MFVGVVDIYVGVFVDWFKIFENFDGWGWIVFGGFVWDGEKVVGYGFVCFVFMVWCYFMLGWGGVRGSVCLCLWYNGLWCYFGLVSCFCYILWNVLCDW